MLPISFLRSNLYRFNKPLFKILEILFLPTQFFQSRNFSPIYLFPRYRNILKKSFFYSIKIRQNSFNSNFQNSSKIYLSSFFIHPNFIEQYFHAFDSNSSIVARSPIQASHCPLQCTGRYFIFEQFACFSQFNWRASIIEGWKVGDGAGVARPRKSVGPIYHRSQLARHSLPCLYSRRPLRYSGHFELQHAAQ